MSLFGVERFMAVWSGENAALTDGKQGEVASTHGHAAVLLHSNYNEGISFLS